MSFPFFTLVPLCLRIRRTHTDTHTRKGPLPVCSKTIHSCFLSPYSGPTIVVFVVVAACPAGFALPHSLAHIHTHTHAHILASIAVAAPIRFIATFYFGLIFAATRRGLCCCCCYAVASNICYGHKEGMGVNASVCVCVCLFLSFRLSVHVSR